MLSREFNRLVACADRNKRLPGLTAQAPPVFRYKWQVTVRPFGDPKNLQWQVFIAPGAINNQIPAITYRTSGDPRGWIMPPDYPGIPQALKLYGKNFLFIDRPLTDPDPPFQLLTAPSPGTLTSTSPDFILLPARIPYFQQPQFAGLLLYQAYVFLTATPLKVSLVESQDNIPLPNRLALFRAYAGQLPDPQATIAAGGQQPVAKLYLVRDPSGQAPDQLLVQQLSFHSFWTLNVQPGSDFYNTGDASMLPTAAAVIIQSEIDAIGDIDASAAAVAFWSA